MPTFGERLKAALSATGDVTPERLAKIGKFSVVTARAWLAKEYASVNARRLAEVCQALNIRMYWIVTGQGGITPTQNLTLDDTRLYRIMSRMPPQKLEQWLRSGESALSKTKP